MRLQFRLPIRHALQHPLHSVLCVIGIALGIAVVLAIDITNESARKAFRLSSEAVSGGASHVIVGGPGGIDEQEYVRLRVDHGIRGLSPVVNGHVTVAGTRFNLIGVDPLADAASVYGEGGSLSTSSLLSTDNAVLLLDSTADSLGLDAPARLVAGISGVEHELAVVGTIEAENDLQRQGLRNVLIADVSTAQLVLGMTGRLSRIDVTAAEPARVEAALPESLTLLPAETRSRTMEQMTRAFRLNLTALSLLALVIGAFLIYNTMTLTVIKRREQFAVLRTLGMTPGQLFGAVVLEALVLAVIGFLLGLAGGVWLSTALLQYVGGTINDLYFSVQVQTVTLTAGSLAKSAGLALVATVVAACWPAWEAVRIPPAAGAVRSGIESDARKRQTPLSAVGVLLWCAAVVLLWWSGDSITAGFASLFFIIMGFALVTPYIMVRMLSLLSPLAVRVLGPVGRMGTRGVRSSLSRTQVAVTALAVAVSAVVGVSVMIDSFRQSVDRWLESFLRADIYIAQQQVHKASGIDPKLIASIGASPEVASLSTGRWVDLTGEHGPVQLFAVDLDRSAFDSYQLIAETNEAVWPAFSGSDAVIVSEPFAYHNGLDAGDTIRLPTDAGVRSFHVAAVFVDYGSDRGVVAMHRGVYNRHWDDPVVTSFALYLRAGVAPEAFVDKLNRDALIGRTLRVRSNRSIRERSLEIFDRTFTITGVLRLLAVCIAAVGILSALTAIQLERAREFAVLRAVGLTPRQLWSLIITESGLMGLIAGAIACPLGLIMAWVLIHVINRRSFGWSMDLVFQPEPWLTAVALSVVAAVAAGLYPALRMAGTAPAAALRYE